MILFCNDQRAKDVVDELRLAGGGLPMDEGMREVWRLRINKEAQWAMCLVQKGCKVRVFDAYYDDLMTPILSPEVGAAFLRRSLEGDIVKAVLFDINYHGVVNYGIEMLRQLKREGCRSIEGPRWIVYSTYLGSHEDLDPRRIIAEFGDMIVAVENRVDGGKRELMKLLERMERGGSG